MLQPTASRSNRILLLVVVIVDSFSLAMILPVIPFFVIHQGIGVVAGGWLVAIQSICSMIASPFLGRLSDRYGRKAMLLLTLSGTGASFLLFAFAHSYIQMFASQALCGLMAGNLSTAQAAIADSSSKSDRGKALGQVAGVWALGYVLGPALSAAVANPAAPAFMPGLIAAAAAFGAALMFAIAYRERREDVAAPAPNAATLRESAWLGALLAGGPRLALAALVLVTLCQSGLIAMTGYWAHQLLGWRQWDVSWLIVWVALGSVVTQLVVAPAVFKRLSNHQALSAVLCVSIAGCATLILTKSALGLIVGVPMIMSGLSLASTVLNTAISHAAERTQGISMGLATSASGLGRILGPVLFGLSFSGLGATSYFYWIGLICLALAALYPIIQNYLHSGHAGYSPASENPAAAVQEGDRGLAP